MSWTDKQSIKVMKYFRDKYKIKTLIETGTFKGINAQLHSKNFDIVYTCENHKLYYNEAEKRLRSYNNVINELQDSPSFLKSFSETKYIFYLDAHFYNPKLPKKERFVVLKELDNMKKSKDSVIIIHDFDNGLGHITYDGIDLDLNLIRGRLKRINKNFHFYTNTLEGCDPVKPTMKDIIKSGLNVDEETLSNLEYAWKLPRLTYRGLLYCLPTKLTKKEMKKLGLREWN